MGEEALEIEYEEDSLTADLADAWSESEGEDNGDDQAGSVHEPDGGGAAAEGQAGPDSGEHSAGGEPGDPVHPAGVPVEEVRADGNETGQGDEEPPVGLPPAAREAWKDTPTPVKEALAKREHDYATGIQRYAESAKRAEGMDRALAPFAQYMAMNGGPGQAVKTLMETGSALQMGSPTQKAQVITNLIRQFGIDVNQLDQMLVGETPTQNPNDALQHAVQQAVAPYQQQVQQFQQHQQQEAQRQQGAVVQEVNDFGAGNEFYNDVRGDMADILDMAANRNQPMTMADAYAKACMLNPEISNIIQSRRNTPTPQQRKAASSISGTPGGVGGPAEPDSTRAAIELAWENAGRT